MRVQRDKHQTWAIPYTMHKEYADNKYSAINLYNNMVNLLCLSNVCRVQRQELVVEL